MSKTSFESLDDLASRLPFHIDDVTSVNQVYARWRVRGRESDHQVVQLWTYCFIRRYFLVKFIRDFETRASDFDELVDKAFMKAEASDRLVNDPTRYASWVSVVCKNTFRNYLRDRRRPVSLEDEDVPTLVAEIPRAYVDAGLAHQALLKAIERLPVYLQECVRLRYIDGLGYGEIAERTGHPPASIRAYIYKAVQRLRSDDDLRDHFQ